MGVITGAIIQMSDIGLYLPINILNWIFIALLCGMYALILFIIVS